MAALPFLLYLHHKQIAMTGTKQGQNMPAMQAFLAALAKRSSLAVVASWFAVQVQAAAAFAGALEDILFDDCW